MIFLLFFFSIERPPRAHLQYLVAHRLGTTALECTIRKHDITKIMLAHVPSFMPFKSKEESRSKIKHQIKIILKLSKSSCYHYHHHLQKGATTVCAVETPYGVQTTCCATPDGQTFEYRFPQAPAT